MRTLLICKDNQDYTREVLDWLREFEYSVGEGIIEQVDPETRDGESITQAYDILEFPAILVTADDGSTVQLWKGTPLPPTSEVGYFAKS